MSMRIIIREVDTSATSTGAPAEISYRTVNLEFEPLEFLLREPRTKSWQHFTRSVVGVELPEPKA
jgi:hypothetical protein